LCAHNGGVDDLPTHGQISPILERGIKAREQPIDRQPLAEQPDRGSIGHAAFQPHAQETLVHSDIAVEGSATS
jgi:hypothetical protein